jgi:hypothetical protein
MNILKKLWEAAYNLSAEDRKKTVRWAVAVASVAVASVLVAAGIMALDVVPAESPVWEAILQSRLVLTRLALALPLLFLGWLFKTFLYQTYENTALGKRTVIWVKTDSDTIRAMKTRNAGTIQAALMLACVLGLLLGVLR